MYTKDGSLVDRREMLRVKSKSLADEARIIRKEESRTFGGLREELHRHRVGVVRFEARATHLAYGMIKGRPIERIEVSSTRTDLLWKKVRTMVEKYGPISNEQLTRVLERCKD